MRDDSSLACQAEKTAKLLALNWCNYFSLVNTQVSFQILTVNVFQPNNSWVALLQLFLALIHLRYLNVFSSFKYQEQQLQHKNIL